MCANVLLIDSRDLGPRTVHGLKVWGYSVYFIYGPENVARLRRYPRTITTPGVTAFVLKTLFGMAPKAIDVYTLDDSGVHANPARGSRIVSHNRIDYLTHANFHKHLLGEELWRTYRGFANSLMSRLDSLEIQDEWKQYPNLIDYWLPAMTSAMNEALAGPMFESINPKFTEDLLKYYPYLHSLLKGIPRWLIPEAQKLSGRLIRNVEAWHELARTRFCERDIDPISGRDPWWGSAFMRERQNFLRKVDNWDAHSIASSDFGIFWG